MVAASPYWYQPNAPARLAGVIRDDAQTERTGPTRASEMLRRAAGPFLWVNRGVINTPSTIGLVFMRPTARCAVPVPPPQTMAPGPSAKRAAMARMPDHVVLPSALRLQTGRVALSSAGRPATEEHPGQLGSPSAASQSIRPPPPVGGSFNLGGVKLASVPLARMLQPIVTANMRGLVIHR